MTRVGSQRHKKKKNIYNIYTHTHTHTHTHTRTHTYLLLIRHIHVHKYIPRWRNTGECIGKLNCLFFSYVWFLRNHEDLAITFDPSSVGCKTGSTSTLLTVRVRDGEREQERGPEAFNVGLSVTLFGDIVNKTNVWAHRHAKSCLVL